MTALGGFSRRSWVVRCIAGDIDQARFFALGKELLRRFFCMNGSLQSYFVTLYQGEYEHCECDFFWAPTTTEVPGFIGLT
jgi:hypothetical protein